MEMVPRGPAQPVVPMYQPTLRDELAEVKRLLKEKNQVGETEDKKKPFRFPGKWERVRKKSLKKPQRLMVLYLNKFGKIEGPLLLPVLEGDMVVVHDKPYEINPKAVWRWGKYNVYLIREIDRRPVSNEDYDDVKKRADCTDSDVFLIKMAMRAVQKQAKKEMGKMALIVIGIIIVGIVIFFFSQG